MAVRYETALAVGNKEGANILKNFVDYPMAVRYETALAKENSLIFSEKALGMVIDGQLSRFKYNVVRSKAPQTYKCIRQAKKYCYPTNINVTESSAFVPLQDLLNHTTNRLILSIGVKKLISLQNKELVLLTKWGFDGTTGHTQYKQGFLDRNNSDSHLLITIIFPLQLSYKDNIIWKNTKPSSTCYCRPLNIQLLNSQSML
ncbi:uncharacterized protein LOC124418816 isoform X1 [Lucilia cuprina]|uniref:uncharacterized protein LOC124418816 isoform X1 n=1 Tax=Lucilia cuprina TaxID=7375 RepID=UPI001F06415C|nr:uncharacterized protein LOC124418816 isoform X1 [Lucilia cuprina]